MIPFTIVKSEHYEPFPNVAFLVYKKQTQKCTEASKILDEEKKLVNRLFFSASNKYFNVVSSHEKKYYS